MAGYDRDGVTRAFKSSLERIERAREAEFVVTLSAGNFEVELYPPRSESKYVRDRQREAYLWVIDAVEFSDYVTASQMVFTVRIERREEHSY